MSKILCVLYDDPVGGYPMSYARDDIPRLDPLPEWADAARSTRPGVSAG